MIDFRVILKAGLAYVLIGLGFMAVIVFLVFISWPVLPTTFLLGLGFAFGTVMLGFAFIGIALWRHPELNWE